MEDLFDLDKNLEDFKRGIKRIEEKNFRTFQDFENAYCNVINQGIILRNYIVQNPSLCNENSLKVLTNQTRDFSLLEEKFKCLYSVIDLTQKLLEKYKEYVVDRVEKKDYNMAIRIYNQLFKFTHNYFFRIDIANLYINQLNDSDKCLEIYKEAEPYLSGHYSFLWQFAQVYEKRKDYYNTLVYMQKAIKLELADIDRAKEAENV